MKAKFITFKAKRGDCIFLVLKDGEEHCHIMIDCGDYTAEIKSFVENELKKQIDVLIATHIDNDHIDGLVTMLKQTPDLTICKLIYNCNQLWDGQHSKPTTEVIKNDIHTLVEKLPSKHVTINGKINADKATTLAEEIAKNALWWKAWKKDEYITVDTPAISLGCRFGHLIVLSPLINDITKLNSKFKTEYTRLTKHIIDDGSHIDGQETLFELVERVAAMKQANYQILKTTKIGATILPLTKEQIKKAYEFEPQGITDENMASIALMWESGDKRVLLMGDAEPDVVADRLEKLYHNKHLNMEAVKVSHHGSKHSISTRLMEIVDSDNYFFTGGNNTDKPSLEAFMKIVNRGDKRQRTLHFHNYDNYVVKTMTSNRSCDLKKQYHFEISSSNELEFEY